MALGLANGSSKVSVRVYTHMGGHVYDVGLTSHLTTTASSPHPPPSGRDPLCRQAVTPFRQAVTPIRQAVTAFRQAVPAFRQAVTTFRQAVTAFRQAVTTNVCLPSPT